MKLAFAQIEAVLHRVHHISEGDRTRFRAKVRNLARVGLPLPSGGKGRKANYHTADLFKLAFAAELLQTGMGPETVALSLAQGWPEAVEALFAARRDIKEGRVPSRWLVARPYLMTSPYVRLRHEEGEQPAPSLGSPARLLIIDVGVLLGTIRQAAREAGLDMALFEASLDQEELIILSKGARHYGNN